MRTIPITINKMYNESEIPKVEFWIILGSKTKIHAPKIAILTPKNFLHIKKIGNIVPAEIIIDENLWIIWKSRNVSGLVILKTKERNTGHPLFGKLYPIGNSPKTLVSIAYQKYWTPSSVIGNSNGV